MAQIDEQLALSGLERWPSEGPDDVSGGMFESGADWFGGLTQAFAPEPLTAEQAVRLPAATALVERIIPPGSMQEVMGSMFDTIISPLAEAIEPDAKSFLAEQLGLNTWDIEGMTPDQAEAAAALLDPAWRERARREAEAAPMVGARMMAAIEPSIRQAMAELYAIYFTGEELAQIDAFFSTPAGANLARQSLRMGSDPRLAGAMMQQMPAMFAAAAAMEAEMAALTADLPAPRSLGDLSDTESKGLASLLGMVVEDLEYLGGWSSTEHGYDWVADVSAADAAADAAAAAEEAVIEARKPASNSAD
jgi:hypothetical protein